MRDLLAASREQAHAKLRAATAQKLIAQAQGMLAGTAPGGDARALQQILAAGTLTTPDDGVLYTALYNAVIQRATTLKIITGHTGAVGVWRSAPTGTGWPAPATTARCACGTPTPANPSATR